MKHWASSLGNPQHVLAIIHVAGTNGKGSVCAMLESVYREAGYRTGMFTSPHLLELGERIQVDRHNILDTSLFVILKKLRASADQLFTEEDYPSFFEFITMAAFLHFQEEAVDIVLLETGLGGRLDSTNIVQPLVSCLTSIALDHQDILGHTYAEIAAEKAGIIKENTPVVMGEMNAESRAVFEKVAAQKNAPLYSVKEVFADQMYPESGLPGGVQRINAACVTICVDLLKEKFPVASSMVARGLANVRWAGRWEEMTVGRIQLILDCTHNVGGLANLEQNLSSLDQKPWIACGFVGDDRMGDLLPTLSKYARGMTCLEINQPKATPVETVKACASQWFDGKIETEQPKRIWTLLGLLEARGVQTLVITGSIYLIGEIKAALSARPSQSELQG